MGGVDGDRTVGIHAPVALVTDPVGPSVPRVMTFSRPEEKTVAGPADAPADAAARSGGPSRHVEASVNRAYPAARSGEPLGAVAERVAGTGATSVGRPRLAQPVDR